MLFSRPEETKFHALTIAPAPKTSLKSPETNAKDAVLTATTWQSQFNAENG